MDEREQLALRYAKLAEECVEQFRGNWEEFKDGFERIAVAGPDEGDLQSDSFIAEVSMSKFAAMEEALDEMEARREEEKEKLPEWLQEELK